MSQDKIYFYVLKTVRLLYQARMGQVTALYVLVLGMLSGNPVWTFHFSVMVFLPHKF